MKKPIIFALFMVFAAISILLIGCQTKVESQLILIPRDHHLIVNETTPIETVVFLAKESDAPLLASAYGILEADENRLLIEEFELFKLHDEVLNDITYYGYEITFYVQELEGVFDFQDAYLTLYFAGNEIKTYFGSLFLVDGKSDINNLYVHGLSGQKDDYQVSEISILLSENILFDQLFVGAYEAELSQDDNSLEITVTTNTNNYLNNPFILLVSGGEKFYVYQFPYFLSQDFLSMCNLSIMTW